MHGRVYIDAFGYYRSCNLVKPNLRSLHDEDRVREDRAHEPIDSKFKLMGLPSNNTSASSCFADYDTKHVPTATIPQGVKSVDKHPVQRNEDLAPLTEEQLLTTTPWVKGFDLKSKDWSEVCVDSLEEVIWNDEAFDKLVLPQDEKEMAWSFINGKRRSNGSEFDDFIQDKGRGLIILMFGPPGVGKTFTAEAVAEKSRVPLYSMSAGDLGTKPADVEKALQRALELCRMWDAMLLLDEADVFLTSRDSESIARNELVSIFLRMLEYYTGILFLTTNRETSIDHAFRSRVDLFLPYSGLHAEARRKIWENFLERTGEVKFNLTDEDLDRLAQINLNGREIKNLIKSARMLLLGDKGTGVSPLDRLDMLVNNRTRALGIMSREKYVPGT